MTQRALLEELGCDELQGYLFSRPVRKAEAASLLPMPARGAGGGAIAAVGSRRVIRPGNGRRTAGSSTPRLPSAARMSTIFYATGGGVAVLHNLSSNPCNRAVSQEKARLISSPISSPPRRCRAGGEPRPAAAGQGLARRLPGHGPQHPRRQHPRSPGGHRGRPAAQPRP